VKTRILLAVLIVGALALALFLGDDTVWPPV
jgi:hypothetical protein